MKNIGILGTGMVGDTIGTKLIELGYEVRMGSRTANNDKAMEWSSRNGAHASTGTFSDAALFAEMLFVCTKGDATTSVIRSLNPANVEGKIIVDVSNPLDFSKGMPPFLIPEVSNTNSLGEEIQKLLPRSKVVKTLNIINCQLMVEPGKLKTGELTMLLAGNDPDAKKEVRKILEQFGWKDVIDLGDITASRGMEMMLPVWVRILSSIKSPHFGFKIVQ
jgi:8-hydroxy-5-deazaflavin:NADPH oxidoreductase